uniref:Uncharacterized protein n=1 Tax=Romanomermis culicivorax TaxID=13658 RepID=A0A915K9X4_ROMCU
MLPAGCCQTLIGSLKRISHRIMVPLSVPTHAQFFLCSSMQNPVGKPCSDDVRNTHADTPPPESLGISDTGPKKVARTPKPQGPVTLLSAGDIQVRILSTVVEAKSLGKMSPM